MVARKEVHVRMNMYTRSCLLRVRVAMTNAEGGLILVHRYIHAHVQVYRSRFLNSCCYIQQCARDYVADWIELMLGLELG